MRSFYILFPIRQTLSAESIAIPQTLSQSFSLSWSHYCLLMQLDEPSKREFSE
ncbi:MAG: hypothetical protein M1491_09970 [Deltaproteobacteria bacterium]|nr:hypothetical protein [Deltaproteobacteria bacterium]